MTAVFLSSLRQPYHSMYVVINIAGVHIEWVNLHWMCLEMVSPTNKQILLKSTIWSCGVHEYRTWGKTFLQNGYTKEKICVRSDHKMTWILRSLKV